MKSGKILKASNILKFSAALALAPLGMLGCTSQLPNAFLLAQQTEDFSSQLQINTKVDLLWVVDNSSSMDVSQQKLRDGFAAFAQKYLQHTWDIRVAVITTDTYLANPAYSKYLASTIPGTVGWKSPYINSRLGTFVNPPSNPTLVNTSTGAFDNGVKFRDLIPAWGSLFSHLLPGLHDGPIAGFCFEGLPYFINGVTQCKIRDDQSAYTGPANCLNPGSGQTSLSQCVNTVENNTIHSGQAILSTIPPQGTPADSTFTHQLISDFIINMTTGTAGHGSERGLGSVLQLMADNESTSTAFFRPGSTRGIIFVSDEDDQTMNLPDPTPNLNPWSHYACDLNSLVAMNGSGSVNGQNGLCCSDPTKGCRFGAEGTSCNPKTVDGYTYTISICPRPDALMPIATIKQEMDSFFTALDGGAATATQNYFVVSIVALTANSIQALQASRGSDDAAVGAYKTLAVDRADRYMALGTAVGNGSFAMDIGSSDYSPILDAIGQTITQKKGTFTLARAPTGTESMTVTVLHADGTSTVLPSSVYSVSGNVLTITDLNTILGFASTDHLSINYQPNTSI